MHRVKSLPGRISENNVINVEAQTITLVFLDVNIKGRLTSEGHDGEQKQMSLYLTKQKK